MATRNEDVLMSISTLFPESTYGDPQLLSGRSQGWVGSYLDHGIPSAAR